MKAKWTKYLIVIVSALMIGSVASLALQNKLEQHRYNLGEPTSSGPCTAVVNEYNCSVPYCPDYSGRQNVIFSSGFPFDSKLTVYDDCGNTNTINTSGIYHNIAIISLAAFVVIASSAKVLRII